VIKNTELPDVHARYVKNYLMRIIGGTIVRGFAASAESRANSTMIGLAASVGDAVLKAMNLSVVCV